MDNIFTVSFIGDGGYVFNIYSNQTVKQDFAMHFMMKIGLHLLLQVHAKCMIGSVKKVTLCVNHTHINNVYIHQYPGVDITLENFNNANPTRWCNSI